MFSWRYRRSSLCRPPPALCLPLRALGAGVKAPAPAVATQTPFGPRIHALAIYCKGFQALFLRASALHVPRRFRPDRKRGRADEYVHPLSCGVQDRADKAKAILRQAKVVASDETGVRIEGTILIIGCSIARTPWWHQPDYSRAARVVAETMNGHTPNVWISDRYSAQQKHGAAHQPVWRIWRATRPMRWSMDRTNLPLRFKLWFGKAFDLARDIASFAASTIASKKRELEKQLAALLAAATECDSHASCRPKSGGRKISF